MPLSRNALKIPSRWLRWDWKCAQLQGGNHCLQDGLTTVPEVCVDFIHFITASIINKADPEKNNSHWEQIICNQVQMMGIMTESALKRWAKQFEGRNVGGNQKGEWVFWRQTISSFDLSGQTCFQNPGSCSPLVMKERFWCTGESQMPRFTQDIPEHQMVVLVFSRTFAEVSKAKKFNINIFSLYTCIKTQLHKHVKLPKPKINLVFWGKKVFSVTWF